MNRVPILCRVFPIPREPENALRIVIFSLFLSFFFAVDDEYLIIGSANINQRSMDGGRDTEMAMGAFQPHHTMAHSADGIPRGSVHGFRVSTWFEHLGYQEEVFDRPWTRECMKRVNELASRYWEEYSRPEPIVDMQGHLMRYPYVIKEGGSIESIPGHEHFPDSNGPVLGADKPTYPRILTV
jgi:phospholipase D1/2